MKIYCHNCKKKRVVDVNLNWSEEPPRYERKFILVSGSIRCQICDWDLAGFSRVIEPVIYKES